MFKLKLLSSAIFSAAAISTSVQAVNFNAFDPKSIAMGGAGVAIADPATAPFFNPALLSIAESDDDFSIELPVIGFRVSDQNDFIDKVDGTDALVNNLDSAINTFNISPATNSVLPVTGAMDALNNKLLSLSNSPLALDGGFGTVVAIPSEGFGLAFSASATISGVGFFTYSDAQTVTDFTADINTLSACAGNLACIASATYNNTANVNTTTGEVSFTTNSDILSEGRFIGIGIAEAGLSISREFFFGSTNISMGITPKMVSISIIDYTANATTVENTLDDFDNVTADYEDFNLDFGAAMDFENGWRGGVTVKNLISQEYASAGTPSLSIKLEPQARVGVSHQNDWSTVAIDIDITENEALGLLNASTQYASLGIELNGWDFAQLRAGYRSDLVNSGRDVFSVGFGLSPFGVHFDLGLAVGESDNEGAVAFQFGFRI